MAPARAGARAWTTRAALSRARARRACLTDISRGHFIILASRHLAVGRDSVRASRGPADALARAVGVRCPETVPRTARTAVRTAGRARHRHPSATVCACTQHTQIICINARACARPPPPARIIATARALGTWRLPLWTLRPFYLYHAALRSISPAFEYFSQPRSVCLLSVHASDLFNSCRRRYGIMRAPRPPFRTRGAPGGRPGRVHRGRQG